MTGTGTKRQRTHDPGTTDERLIQQCLKGDQEAWSALIDKYKNLIYSIPIKYGLYQDAGDIFQAVCVDLLLELPKIREYRALPKWLMRTCYHKCLRHQQTAKREVEMEPAVAEQHAAADLLPEDMLAQLTEEQALRDLLSEMSARCRQMIHMLFFEIPARPYEEVARSLGLATGSIGFIRGRCLSQLRKQLEKKGF